MRYTFLLAAAMILVGCGGTPAVTEQPATPALAAATQIPLADLEIETLIIQDGDLPAGIEPAQMLDTAPPAYESMQVPGADKIAFQRLQRTGQPAGYVVVSLYEDSEALADAYDLVAGDVRAAADIGESTIEEDIGVGDQSIASESKGVLSGAHVAYRHCTAVVSAYFSGELIDIQSVTAYARRLDRRLTPLVCR